MISADDNAYVLRELQVATLKAARDRLNSNVATMPHRALEGLLVARRILTEMIEEIYTHQ